MIIAGAILVAIGIGSTIYGFYLNNSLESQLNALFSSGNIDPGTAWIVAGIIAVVIGIVLLAVGMAKKPDSKPKDVVSRPVAVKVESLCPNCGKKLDGSPAFCPFCGKSTASASPKKEELCPYCESILPPDVVFCPACGKPIVAEAKPVVHTYVPPKPAEPSAGGGWNTPTDSDL